MLRVVIVTIGLLLALNGLVTLIWSGEVRAMESPFPTRTIDIAGVAISIQDIGTIAVVLGTVVVLWALFQYTKVGLAMRAAAVNPAEARLVGVRVTWMLSLGWGLAAVLGAISGMLAAPSLFLDPNMMAALLIYAFAAAVLGGIDSPVGAVVGGLMLGVGLNLIGTYVDFVGAELRLPAALLVILVVLLVKPAGHLRQARGEAGMRRSRALAPVVAFVVLARRRRSCCRRSCRRLPRPAARVRRDLPHRADRPQHPDRLHRPDLARPRRVHGDRRLHDRDPDVRPRREGICDDPARGRRRRRRRVPVRDPGAPALGALPRPRDVRDRGRDAGRDQAVRGVHRRRRRHQPVRARPS